MKEIHLNGPKEELEILLHELGFLDAGEVIIDISKPGEGNMNVVVRVTTNHRRFILKQSRPYVQKYPSIPAPLDRINTENIFYDSIQQSSSVDHFPSVLGYNSDHHLLQLSDLGECHDMSGLYHARDISTTDIKHLCNVLASIHSSKVASSYPLNEELRRLNHQHIFVLPFLEDNGFQLDDIQPGLQALSEQYKSDKSLKDIVRQIGDRYLTSGDTLLHGDYYPGSWMRSVDRIYILDPEFSFVGFREFDIGVMMAHLILIEGSIDVTDRVGALYIAPFDHSLARKVAGIEIIRRLIGLAQLPLDRSLTEKKSLLEISHGLIMKSS